MEGAILETFPEVSLVWLLTGNGNMLKSVRVEGSGNATVNGDHSTATIGVDGSRLLDQLDRKDEQVNRLLAIIERMQGHKKSPHHYGRGWAWGRHPKNLRHKRLLFSAWAIYRSELGKTLHGRLFGLVGYLGVYLCGRHGGVAEQLAHGVDVKV